MSETVGIIVIVAGLGASAVGMWYLSKTRRQVLGLAMMVVGFIVAGTGLLAIDDSQVQERTTSTVESGTPVDATPSA